MILFQNLFSSIITAEQQHELLCFLGVARQSFRFVEAVPGLILRSVEFREGDFSVFLDPKTPQQLEAWIAQSDLPVVIRNHAFQFPVAEPSSKKDLAQWLLPYPWSLFFTQALGSDNLQIRSSDFQKKVEQWRRAFSRLETRLLGTELGCLLLDEGEVSRAFLCHSVQGKIMRASFFPEFSLNNQASYLQQTQLTVIPPGPFLEL